MKFNSDKSKIPEKTSTPSFIIFMPPCRKRKAEEEIEEEQNKRDKAEWDKNFEESRQGRVNSWMDFTKKKGKSGTEILREFVKFRKSL